MVRVKIAVKQLNKIPAERCFVIQKKLYLLKFTAENEPTKMITDKPGDDHDDTDKPDGKDNTEGDGDSKDLDGYDGEDYDDEDYDGLDDPAINPGRTSPPAT